MLVASYDESFLEDEDSQDQYDWMWEDFKVQIQHALKGKKFPLQLIAVNSNWRGQTGYAQVDSVQDILSKLAGFDSTFYELYKVGNTFEFRLASHDRPTGFTVLLRSLNYKYKESNARIT